MIVLIIIFIYTFILISMKPIIKYMSEKLNLKGETKFITNHIIKDLSLIIGKDNVNEKIEEIILNWLDNYNKRLYVYLSNIDYNVIGGMKLKNELKNNDSKISLEKTSLTYSKFDDFYEENIIYDDSENKYESNIEKINETKFDLVLFMKRKSYFEYPIIIEKTKI